jgi:hypothetical protein
MVKHLKAAKGEKPQTIKNRVVRAAKSLNMDLQVKRVGDNILFWRIIDEMEE